MRSEPDSGRITWYTDWVGSKDPYDIRTEEVCILHLRKDENDEVKAALQRAAEKNLDIQFYSVLSSARIRNNSLFIYGFAGIENAAHIKVEAGDLDKQLEDVLDKTRLNSGLKGEGKTWYRKENGGVAMWKKRVDK